MSSLACVAIEIGGQRLLLDSRQARDMAHSLSRAAAEVDAENRTIAEEMAIARSAKTKGKKS